MLISNHMQPDPETQARQALARVYALLIKLAESDPQDTACLESQAQEPHEVKYETKQAE